MCLTFAYTCQKYQAEKTYFVNSDYRDKTIYSVWYLIITIKIWKILAFFLSFSHGLYIKNGLMVAMNLQIVNADILFCYKDLHILQLKLFVCNNVRLIFVIHILPYIAWWQPSWNMGTTVEKSNMPLSSVKNVSSCIHRDWWLSSTKKYQH